MDMFDKNREDILSKSAPLADRMRPRTLDEFVGQKHIVGPGRLLRRAIQIDQLSSLIFYGPPGTGKTTLARIIANTTKAQFLQINAVLAGVKDIRQAIDTARQTLSLHSRRTILFIDEVHRFNKSQQDALLPHVENGVVILIGATTENPYFEVNKALVSRSRVFELRSLTDHDLREVARQAIADPERGYGSWNMTVDEDALAHLVHVANGDARGVLNALELAAETTERRPDGSVRVTREVAEESIQRRAVLYDKEGDVHYDTISAFIKSLRGSDPDAALYWMAKMVYAGEDPRFIFRRMMILACEDIGMADPRALGVVVDAARAFDYVGMPEGRYHLAHACLYCATAPKSNSSMAFFDALDAVSKEVADDVPNHLRDASRDSEGLGHGQGYLYPHAYRDHWVAQQYLPRALQGKLFYEPAAQGYEKGIRDDVMRHREAQIEAMAGEPDDDPLETGGRGMQTKKSTRDRWIKRTSGATGGMLESVRERIFELASPGRDSLVLDLNGRTGLLAFEAARRCPDGGVWVIARDDKSEETLKTLAHRLGPLHRPQVVRAGPEDFDARVREACGPGVAFDVIIGRNVVFDRPDKLDMIRRALGLAAGKGVVVLAETIPSGGQRLFKLVRFESGKIAARFRESENELFADSKNAMVNWTSRSLEEEIRGSAASEARSVAARFRSRRRLAPEDIEFWFRSNENGAALSLGDRLRRGLEPADVDSIKQALHAQLDYRDVDWETTVGFFVIRKA
ncbi:MAG: AAA family ATPase [Chitinivibrionales bacterium]|nr:AAA family ATPase [Chitinivibrionales bacterium]MBD3395132.1 AAA family ATPase [Chitinivibrionales bacterium]